MSQEIQHLREVCFSTNHDKILALGTWKQLNTIVKIQGNTTIDACFNSHGEPLLYPKLPERHFLVACVEGTKNLIVFLIFSLTQMEELADARSLSTVKKISWYEMEIP